MFRSYIAILQGMQPVQEQGFWKHVLRYRLLHMFFGVCVLIVSGVFFFRYVTPDTLQKVYTNSTQVMSNLYTSGLVLTYDSTDGLATNLTGPVIRTVDQVRQEVSPYVTNISEEMNSGPKNLLVIDTSGSVDDFASYDTLFLFTDTYLVAGTTKDIRVVPLINNESIKSTQVVIDKAIINSVIEEGSAWFASHSHELRRTLFFTLVGGGFVFLLFLAFIITFRLSVGMLMITLVSRWISKIWVRVSFRQLFTWLSLSYLPVYVILKMLMRSRLVPDMGIIGYIAMIACLAIYIVRAEEKKTNISI